MTNPGDHLNFSPNPRLADFNIGTIYNFTIEEPSIKTDAAVYRERRTAFMRDIGNGIMPELDSGFDFVIHQPNSRESLYIPVTDFTRYFSNRQVPIVAPGHYLHGHDTNHGPNYQTLFKDQLFADLTQKAAHNALSIDKILGQEYASQTFTNAIDKFSDHMLILEENIQTVAQDKLNSIENAETYLGQLIKLAEPDLTPEDHEAIAVKLKKSLDINAYKAREEKQREINDQAQQQNSLATEVGRRGITLL